MDVYDALEAENYNVDAWYLDGFSPAKNPDMWSQQLFEKLAQNSHTGTTCSTYTSAGFVKRNMQAAGFLVNKVSGCGKKREMLVAELIDREPVSLKYKDKPWFKPPLRQQHTENKATIIGAGIAGLSLAYALVNRGWVVSIIDKHGDIAKEASSNPAPIVYPRLSINNDVDTEFYTAAFFYTLHVFKKLQEQSKHRFWFGDGLQQLMDEKRITKIIKKFQFNSDYVSVSDEMNAEQRTVNYPSAGVVLPAILCDVIKNACGKKLNIINAEVNNIKYEKNKWLCLSDSQLIDTAEILIIANGTGINELGLLPKFPVEAIRGQVVELNANPVSQQIRKTINAAVHITPVINSKHYLGASYVRGCCELEVCQKDSLSLIESLNNLYPDIFKEDDYCDAWVGFRTMSKDRVPIVGAIPDEVFFNDEYADICHGKVNKNYQPAQYLKGLYVSAAHGSRGFTSSFLSAEIIVSLIEGEPVPTSRRVLNYLNPSRFIVNNLKCR
jgi:tRNA 5-methylaminomethyl-2-thiouridine biosynthesis bifunctional protein